MFVLANDLRLCPIEIFVSPHTAFRRMFANRASKRWLNCKTFGLDTIQCDREQLEIYRRASISATLWLCEMVLIEPNDKDRLYALRMERPLKFRWPMRALQTDPIHWSPIIEDLHGRQCVEWFQCVRIVWQ